MKLHNLFYVMDKNDSHSLSISVGLLLLSLLVLITTAFVILVLEFTLYVILLVPLIAMFRVIYAMIKGK